jgi:hypothetical protein
MQVYIRIFKLNYYLKCNDSDNGDDDDDDVIIIIKLILLVYSNDVHRSITSKGAVCK